MRPGCADRVGAWAATRNPGIPGRHGTLADTRDPAGRDGLDAILTRPDRAVIALDFDGTLAPIVADPEQARAHPDAVPALAALAPKVASVAVVTGRPAGVAVRHGGFAGVPGLDHLVVLGHYGAERWDARTGTVNAPPAPRRRRRPRRAARGPRRGRRLARHLDRGEGPRGRGPHPPRGGPLAAFEALREPSPTSPPATA